MPEFDWLPMVGALLVISTSFTLLLNPSWRVSLATLAVQYLGIFILVSSVLPFELALAKLVTGWMAAAVLGMSISGLVRQGEFLPDGSNPLADRSPETSDASGGSPGWQSFSGRAFRLLTGLLAAMVGFTIAPQLTEWVPGLSSEQAWGSVILLGVGLLQLGFTVQPFRTILGLLTFLAGFEVVYAAAEQSALVTGFLAVVTLGLSLAGAYLLMVATLEEST